MNAEFYEHLAAWSQVVGAVAFIAVVVWAWNRFLTPAVLASQQRKNAELADMEARRDKARDAIDAAQKDVSDAENDARGIAARAASDASRVSERIDKESQDEGERVVRVAGLELERGRAAAREQVRVELLDRALAIARVEAAKLDASADRRLVDEAVATAARTGAN